jgi:hypothetical protein
MPTPERCSMRKNQKGDTGERKHQKGDINPTQHQKGDNGGRPAPAARRGPADAGRPRPASRGTHSRGPAAVVCSSTEGATAPTRFARGPRRHPQGQPGRRGSLQSACQSWPAPCAPAAAVAVDAAAANRRGTADRRGPFRPHFTASCASPSPASGCRRLWASFTTAPALGVIDFERRWGFWSA